MKGIEGEKVTPFRLRIYCLNFRSKRRLKKMMEAVICAAERMEKPNKARKAGFIPGVIYGKDINSTPIKIDRKEFGKLLFKHGRNVKVNVKFRDEIKHCIIKEIHRNFLNGEILHVDLQTVNVEDTIRLKVPVVFNGKERLAARKELLHVFITEVELMGKAADIPEIVAIEVGDKNLGDKITVKDIHVADNIKIMEDENEILAVVTAAKEHGEESSEGSQE